MKGVLATGVYLPSTDHLKDYMDLPAAGRVCREN
jgi:hypothetical protein